MNHQNPSLPSIGFGTYELGENAEVCIETAIRSGVRLIDTASAYGTEEFVGKAVNAAVEYGIFREDLIVTSKISPEDHAKGYQAACQAIQHSLDSLSLDYIDLYLIHWPIPRFHETDYKELNLQVWTAMEEAVKKGYIKHIGVSNFLPRHLKNLMDNSSIPPAVNQLEIHPFYQQKETVDFCLSHGIAVESWGPFRHGQVFSDSRLQTLAEKHSTTIAQVCLNWLRHRQIIPLFKSSNPSRIEDNFQRFSREEIDFTAEELLLLSSLDTPDGHEDFWSYKRQLAY